MKQNAAAVAQTPKARVLALNRRVAAGDESARPELSAALAEVPSMAIDPATMAVGMTLRSYKQPIMEEAAVARMAKIKEEFGHVSAPPLERLLIEQIASCWLRVAEAELMYSQIMAASHKPGQSVYAERRLSACQRRYTQAIVSLARVRRLSRRGPDVQVNIANQQIVAGGA